MAIDVDENIDYADVGTEKCKKIVMGRRVVCDLSTGGRTRSSKEIRTATAGSTNTANAMSTIWYRSVHRI